MDSERYHLIKSLFQDAFEREPADRPAFLEAACGGDSQLRDEVVALLEFDEGEGFAEHAFPAVGGMGAKLLATFEAGSQKSSHHARDTIAPRIDRRRLILLVAGGVGLVVAALITATLISSSSDRTSQSPDIKPTTDVAVTLDTHRLASRPTGGSADRAAASHRAGVEAKSLADLFLLGEFGDLVNWTRHDDDTEPQARQWLVDSRRTLGDTHLATLLAMHDLAEVLLRLDRSQEAEELSNQVVQLSPQQLSANHPFHLAAVAQHGRVLMALGRYADAERALLQSYQGCAETRGEGDERSGDVAVVLSAMYAEWHIVEPGQGYGDKSAYWRTRGNASMDPEPR